MAGNGRSLHMNAMGRAELIHGDRREDNRYQYEMELRFTYGLRGTTCFGTGRTEDLSRTAVRFTTETPPPMARWCNCVSPGRFCSKMFVRWNWWCRAR